MHAYLERPTRSTYQSPRLLYLLLSSQISCPPPSRLLAAALVTAVASTPLRSCLQPDEWTGVPLRAGSSGSPDFNYTQPSGYSTHVLVRRLAAYGHALVPAQRMPRDVVAADWF